MGRTAPTSAAAIAAATLALNARQADAGNSSVAALANAGVFTGVWKSTQGFARVDLALTLAAAGTLAVQHSDDGVNAEAALTETWPAAAATHPTFPTALQRKYYRVVLTDTGGGGAVSLAATLDPQGVDHAQSLEFPAGLIGTLGAGANTTVLLPLGTRRIFASCASAAAQPEDTGNTYGAQMDAGGTRQDVHFLQGRYGVMTGGSGGVPRRATAVSYYVSSTAGCLRLLVLAYP